MASSSYETVNLAYAAEQGLSLLPPHILSHLSEVRYLDLSYNNLSSLSLLGKNPPLLHLHSLILDGNFLSEHVCFPPLPSLLFLSLNKNEISDVSSFVEWLKDSAPNLEIVAIAQQRGKEKEEGDEEKKRKERKMWAQAFPRLTLLDSTLITEADRKQETKQEKESEREKEKEKDEDRDVFTRRGESAKRDFPPSRKPEPSSSSLARDQTTKAKDSLSVAAVALCDRSETLVRLEKDAHTLGGSMREWRQNMKDLNMH